MAYSPLDQGGAFLHSPVLQDIAENHNASPAQIALAWLFHQKETIVIPKSSRPQRITENFAALEIRLGAGELAELDRSYPPPTQPVRLGMR